MNDEGVILTLRKLESDVTDIYHITDLSVTNVRDGILTLSYYIKNDISCNLSLPEACLTSHIVIVTQDAEFHLLRAYYHASPSLIAILTAIYGFIVTVIEIVTVISQVLKVITGEDLAYWLDKLMPGFQKAWDNILKSISEVSSLIGWGVDGLQHFMNIGNIASTTLGAITGKDPAWTKSRMYDRASVFIDYVSVYVNELKTNPGAIMGMIFNMEHEYASAEGSNFINKLTDKLGNTFDKVETVTKGLGNITSEMLSMRNDMPSFIAAHIPASIWDSITRADTMINDRLGPAITLINRRIDEIDNLLERYTRNIADLASKIARPGNMLQEINALPEYVRKDQLSKIDAVTSFTMAEKNKADLSSIEPSLKEFAQLAEAAKTPPAPLEFMILELPGKSSGIKAEPRETWAVGDY